ncbi:MFS transporter [Sphingomonas panacis]|uniref:MFS transporter n=1 Tax=Sphingomonas panacis TaxID=1560345 RepID=UPI000A8CBC75|nr:MFS transporter [Sphingomonas panacis]
MPHPRIRTVLLWLCGVLAAAQLGKFSALAPALQARFGLDLPSLGLLISLLEVGGAAFGFVAGRALPRHGIDRALLSGLFLLVIATVIEATARTTPILFAARSVEGLAYLLVVVAAPTMIVATTSPGREREGAMVLWSTFIPVGSGLGSIVTGLLATALGTTMAMLFWAFAELALLALLTTIPASAPAPGRAALPALPAWLLSIGFGCYTLSLCAVTGLMPAFLHDRYGLDIAEGSVIAGATALSALPGSLLALAAIRLLATRTRRLLLLVAAALVLASGLSLMIFRANCPILVALSAGAMLLLAGMARAVIFAWLPGFSGGHDAADPRIAAAQGLLTQLGALGALVGPPLGATSVGIGSWSALGPFVASIVLVLLAMIVGAYCLHRPHADRT